MPLPQQAQQKYQQGAAAFDQGRFAEALQLFEMLVKQYPEEAKLYFALGVIWRHLGEREKAIPYLEKAAELSFDLPGNPYNKIANILSLDAKDQGRRPWLDKARDWAIASKNPLEIAQAKYNLAVADGNVEDSLRYVKEALSYAPDDLDLLTYLSSALLTLGDAEGARKIVQDALDRNILGFRIHYAQALNYRALDQEEKTIASLERAAFGPDAIRFQTTKYYRFAAKVLTSYYFRKGRFRDVMKISLQTVELRDRLKQEAKMAMTQ